jgi:hypothetical protein
MNDLTAQKQSKSNLPAQLKANIEAMSGFSMDDVRVHYNSSKPAQMKALAYTQGTDIHVGPGQEKHLGHEAWHVVQQKQGRVAPTAQLKGVNVNTDEALEHEADVMGAKASVFSAPASPVVQRKTASGAQGATVQFNPKTGSKKEQEKKAAAAAAEKEQKQAYLAEKEQQKKIEQIRKYQGEEAVAEYLEKLQREAAAPPPEEVIEETVANPIPITHGISPKDFEDLMKEHGWNVDTTGGKHETKFVKGTQKISWAPHNYTEGVPKGIQGQILFEAGLR